MHLKTKCHIIQNGPPGEKSIFLKDQCGQERGLTISKDSDLARAGFKQPSNQPQEGRFSEPLAEDSEELASIYLQVYPLQGCQFPLEGIIFHMDSFHHNFRIHLPSTELLHSIIGVREIDHCFDGQQCFVFKITSLQVEPLLIHHNLRVDFEVGIKRGGPRFDQNLGPLWYVSE